MDGQFVDRLLRTLDVSIDAFAVCQAERGQKLGRRLINAEPQPH